MPHKYGKSTIASSLKPKPKATPKNKTPPKHVFNELTQEYKNIISKNSYIGKKGYTISKSLLSKEDEEFIRNDLFVKPDMKCPIYAENNAVSFPVFRESSNKIYIPRFYGITRYGFPEKMDIEPGENINLQFSKELRDYQINIINIYMNYVRPNNENPDSQANPNSGAILEVPCGRGKTVMALKIISLLSKKTIILVHKEFLMNQWIERIEEFLPNAKIGKIQGPIFDIENKDIVIGMIQSMYNRDFAPDAFSSFGLTIIDEVHRIGSEEFSKTLFRIITPYMLGISATVERKDGLTKILYMYIGEKIYTETRKDEDLVCVRGIKYTTQDSVFNEMEYDYRGNPKYSTMITKLSTYGPRSDFIVKIIADLLQEDPNKQIMVLTHNRSLLEYLYNAIEHKKIDSVGYYVGGMKRTSLIETESKKIVLATYAMAAEALDIKTLSTLIMASPRTDIEQSVGRILRARHANPVVIDIIDSHDIFQNQWRQRKRFYKKCNYMIRTIQSNNYKGMNIDWSQDNTWKCEYDPTHTKKIICEPGDDEPEEPKIAPKIGKCLIHMDENEL
jgi:superfamily II DNA or RNA helicase